MHPESDVNGAGPADTVRAGRIGDPAPPADGPIVACASDDGYSMPLAITLFSALANYSGSSPLRIFVLDGGISEVNRERIRRVTKPFGPELHFVKPDESLLVGVPAIRHMGISAYYRLLLPELLPPEVERVIYLDSDLLVEGDLARLWEQDMEDCYLLAVQDAYYAHLGATRLAECPGVEDPSRSEYFNSGVMVIALDRWRRDDVASRVLDFVKAWPEFVRYADQDGLNVVARERWGKLDPVWNQVAGRGMTGSGVPLPGGILHFVGPHKPWLPAGAHPTARAYEAYLQRSGWFEAGAWPRFRVRLLIGRGAFQLRRLLGSLFRRVIAAGRRPRSNDARIA